MLVPEKTAATIVSVRSAHYHLPRVAWWPVPLEDHTLAIDAIDVITCEIEDSNGVKGMGYTYTLSHGGGVVHELIAQELAPLLVGRAVVRPEPIWNELWAKMLRYGRGGIASVALSAVDVALWDLAAKVAGLPLYRYLGAHRESVEVYGSSIDLGYSTEKLVETVTDWVARGFPAVKVKVGRTLPEDIERLTAVRRAIGPDIELMVDANNGWDLPEAGRRIAAMERFSLSWVEEPLMPDDIRGHAALQRQSGIAVAAGETLFSVADFQRYFDAGALRFVQADIGRVGGITPWMAVARLAEAHHLPMAPHFLHDLHVHLLCAVPNAARLEYLPLLDAVLQSPLHVAGGVARPPSVPGHGVKFLSEAMRAYLRAEHRVSVLDDEPAETGKEKNNV